MGRGKNETRRGGAATGQSWTAVRFRWLVGTAGASLTCAPVFDAVAVAAERAPTQTRSIQSIRATEGEAGKTSVTIRASDRPTFTTWKLEQPARLVVDISGARLGDIDVPFDAGTFAVGGVSASTMKDEGGARTRVVITLRQPSEYQVRAVGTDIVLDVVPNTRPVAAASRPSAGDDGTTLALQRAEAARRAAEQGRQSAEADARRLTEEKLKADESRAAIEAASRKLAEERAELDTRRERAEAAQRAVNEASRKLADEKAELDTRRERAEAAQRAADEASKRLADAQGKSSADRGDADRAARKLGQKLIEERSELEARRVRAEAAQRTADAAAQALAQERAALEARRARADEAQRAAEVLARKLTEERTELDARRKRVEDERAAAESARAAAHAAEQRAQAAVADALAVRNKAQDRMQSASRTQSEEAARQLAAARNEVERARAEADKARNETRLASAERSRLEEARKQLLSERAAMESRRAELSRAERENREAERAARATMEKAATEAATAKVREEARRAAVAQAADKVLRQQEAFAAKQREQQSQARKIEEAARVVAEREAAVAATARELAVREQAVAQAAAHQKDLARSNQSSKAERASAARSLSDALAEQKRAAIEAERSRAVLAQAAGARQHEEARKLELERERSSEQHKLDAAIAARGAEESRRLQAAQQRKAEEDRLSDAQARREKLDADRLALEKEVARLKGELATSRASAQALAAAARAPAPVVAPKAPAPAAVVARPATAPVLASDPAAATRPRGPHTVTLQVASRVQRVDFIDEPVRSSIVIDLDEPSAFTIERVTGRRLTLRLRADLPRALERSLDATEYLGPVRLISTYRDPGNRGGIRVDVELAEEVPNRVRQDGARLYWDFQKLGPGSAAAHDLGDRRDGVWQIPMAPARFAAFRMPPGALVVAQGTGTSVRQNATKKRFSGRRIDLDFKGADIHNILRLLSDVGGVNIVTSDDVKGEVTIKMRDVPWDQALDVVLRAKMLGQVREGNLIRVAPLQVLEKELEQEIARQKQITDVMPTETRLIGLSYAEAKSIQDRAKDLLSARGKISVDERTNNLIVSDVAKNLSLVEDLVKNLDTQTSQVVIEARIVEARSTFTRALGIQWGGTGFLDAAHGNPTGLVFPSNVGFGGGAADAQTNTGGLVPSPQNGLPGSQSPNFAVNLPAAVGQGSGGALGLTLGSVAGAFNLNLRLSALEDTGQVRIVSAPRISTVDNTEASIEQGVSIPISVVSAAGVQTIFVDAKLNLTVKPHVTNEGTVIMNVHVSRNEPDFSRTGARGDPTILKKEAKTVMLVRDGDTAVIGGIFQRNSGLNYSKVPFFADIPIVGYFFRSRKENDDRTEFLVFITPRIANRARAIGQ